MFLMIGHTRHFWTSVIKAHKRIFLPRNKSPPGPASAAWNLHLSCQKEASVQIPWLLTATMTSLINYPCVWGGTDGWRQQMGKWVFPLQINVYEVCIWHFISSPGWGPSGRTLAEHVVCQLPGYLGWLGNVPFIWNAQSVWEREHNYI